MKHFFSIEQQSAADLKSLLAQASQLKAQRGSAAARQVQPLAGQVWGMIFTKASTRTRVSFEVGVRELGGQVFFMSPAESQLGRGEPIKDTARVMGRMVHGAIIRTFAQADVEEFAHYGGIPVINALTDQEHPCQIMADLLTVQEKLGSWEGRKAVFIGDGDNNMARSWMWAAERLGFDLVIAAPRKYQPSAEYLAQFKSGRITCSDDPIQAVNGAHILNTDVFTSMGQEAESALRLQELGAYQINKALLAHAAPGAIVLHCLPAHRGEEITEEALEAHADTIFQQAENRLHAQKAVLWALAAARQS